MQPDSFAFRQISGHDGQCNRKSGDGWIGELVAVLTKGDITKREQVLWGYNLKECEPFIEYCAREVRFHKEVLRVLGVEEVERSGPGVRSTKRLQAVGEYCGGSDVVECMDYFKKKEVLERICATCPT